MYVVWGTTFLGIKYAGETLPPLLMLAARFGAAGPILLFLTLRNGAPRPTLVQWRNSAVVGACLLGGGPGLVTLAEKHVPTGVTALMIAATPLWLALLDRIWRGVRLRSTTVVGLAIGFAGVVFLAWPTSGFNHEGIIMLTISPVTWATGSIFSRGAEMPDRPLVAAACEMTAVVPILLIAAAGRGEYGELGSLHPSWKSIAALAYLITIGSLAGFSAYVWLLAVAPVSLVGTYAFVNPIVAVVLGRIFLDEVVDRRVLVAAVVIVAAVALIVSSQGRGARSPAEVEP